MMATKYQDPFESITDAAAYETLQKENPALLTTIEECLAKGATAKSIERRMARFYGYHSIVRLLVAGAAHHIEKAKS